MLPRREHIFVFIRGNIARDRITVNDAVSPVIRFSTSKLEQFNLVNFDLFVVRIDLTTWKYKGNVECIGNKSYENSISSSWRFPVSPLMLSQKLDGKYAGSGRKKNIPRYFSFYVTEIELLFNLRICALVSFVTSD